MNLGQIGEAGWKLLFLWIPHIECLDWNIRSTLDCGAGRFRAGDV